ncbi:hypothetical protein PQ478_08580 [Alkalihalophilus pseudofirmus]|uniref:hypothetical protein n=1 Tax=Alkalihalophilus pseudofirmus TaxID=79885 RepID=UPI00259B1BC0|nr:hypothetical protein [Alkalihalophilus pseudofirmus]WEG18524.1 hypothetical protein PQ478_08580 [Alkalihalophilus pseudofirmus]
MYGFIGLGQAGSSICNIASKMNFPSVAINYSEKDLLSCVNIEEENKLCLIGSEGVGKDRQQAIKLMNTNWERVTSFIEEKFSHPSIEIIFIVYSTGGGSGSGISSLVIDLLQNKMNKVFVACPILPSLNEVATSQLNTIEAMSDLSGLDIAVLSIDNEKGNATDKGETYQKINYRFINQLNQLLHYTEQESTISNLDKRDLLTLFSTQGLINISELNLVDLNHSVVENEKWVNQALIKSWDDQIYITPEKKRLIRMGLIVDCHSSVLKSLELQQLYNQFESGEPLALYEGYYETGQNKILTILTGLSWCEARIRKIEERIQTQEVKLGSLFEEEIRYTPTISTQRFKQPAQQEKKKRSALDILSKYKR